MKKRGDKTQGTGVNPSDIRDEKKGQNKKKNYEVAKGDA